MTRKHIFTHLYDTEEEAQSARKLLMGKFGSSLEKIKIIQAPYGYILQVDTKEISENVFREITAEIEPRPEPKISPKQEKPSRQVGLGKPAKKIPRQKPKPKPKVTAKPVRPAPRAKEPAVPKRKSTAVLLAVFLGLWSWLYTYDRDKLKFWVNLILAVITFGFWGIISWVWAIVDTAVKPPDFYQNYPAVRAVYPKRAYFFIVIGSIVSLVSIFALIVLIGTSTKYTITTSVDPVGSGTIISGEGTFAHGEQVTLTATPVSGYRFDHWGGDATGTSIWITITMDSNKSITAHFKAQYALITSVSPSGGGIVSPPSGTYWEDVGTVVTLTATPTSGYRFDHWGGDATGTSNPVTVTMDADKKVIAYFKALSSPSLPPSSPELLFEDDFSNPSSGWDVGSYEAGDWAYEDGEYSLLVKKINRIIWGQNDRIGQLDDFVIEVDARQVGGPEDSAGYGLVFRDYPEYYFYYFRIAPHSRSYAIEKLSGIGNWSTLKDWTFSDFINSGNSINHLKVVCKGAQIEVYVNGHKLTTVTDYSFSKGDVSLAAETSSKPNVHVHFDNFKLYAVK
jgi:hypothetical protein